MRFVILFLIISFVSSAFAQGDSQENTVNKKNSYSTTHKESGFSLSIFLKENSEEKNEANDKAFIPTAELIDFSFLTTVLTQYHSRADSEISTLRTKQERLFRLNCTLLI